MIEFNKLLQAVRMIENSIITPVIYLNETEFKAEFICFSSEEVTEDDLFRVGESVSRILEKPAEVVDIMEYNANDRVDIITNAELVYSDDPIVEQMFTMSMAEEHRRLYEQKQNMLRRKNESGSYYLQ